MSRRLSRTAAFVALWRQLRAAHRGEPTLGARLRALPRMSAASLWRRQRYDGLWRLVLMALALLYLVSPLDLVPELLLGPLGLVDDLALVVWLAGAVLSETGRFLEWERHRAVAGEIASGATGAEPDRRTRRTDVGPASPG
jgi:uncharacterized membrane protein YkvA (DUF1232 family)